MFNRILFAHDGRMLAERALVYLEHVARVEEAEVVVLHVYQSPEQYSATESYDQLREVYEIVAQEIVDDAVSYLGERGVTATGMVRAGDSARVILEVAAQADISLIVMGSRGPSSMAEVMLGSVSLEVLRGTQVPVLVVP